MFSPTTLSCVNVGIFERIFHFKYDVDFNVYLKEWFISFLEGKKASVESAYVIWFFGCQTRYLKSKELLS